MRRSTTCGRQIFRVRPRESVSKTRKEIYVQMKLHSYSFFAALALTFMGLTLVGCQQAPAAPAAAAAAPAVAPAQAAPPPATATESSSSTRSTEVKSDPSNSGASVEKTVTTETNTVKQQQ
jgi:hypothetical protein